MFEGDCRQWLTTEWIGRNFSYKPDFQILARETPHGVDVHGITRVEDTYHPGQTITVSSGTYTIRPNTSEDEVLEALRKLVHDWIRHETDEQLTVRGERRWDPHA